MLVPLDDARSHVLARVGGALPAEVVAAAEAVGRVAAEELRSAEAMPPFDNSGMDGYAVRAADLAGAPVTLREAGRTLAGDGPGAALAAGEVQRIMTGAPVPPGADAVVPIEVVEVLDSGDVRFATPARAGDHLRRAGDDLRVGDEILTPGTVLGPGHLGLLATVGVEKVAVVRRPRVGVISTGDELVQGAATLEPGQIRDSNRPALLALVAEAGGEPVDLGHAPDDVDAIAAAVRAGVQTCDAILSSGGVSMGDVDLVKVVLDDIGEMRWMQVAIKPAKPFAFGVVDGVPVFGLPGNPVSSMVSFELFARPAIRQLAGHPLSALRRPEVAATAVDGFSRRPDGKVHFVRVVASAGDGGRLEARSAGGQGSHQLSGMAAANALAVVADGDGVAAGDTVPILLTGALV